MKEMKIDKRIITLILKHTMEVITPSEQQELDAWRQADPTHEKAFQWLSQPENLEKDYRLRQSMDIERSLKEVKSRLANEKTTKVVPLRSRLFTTRFYRIAAVIVLLIVGGTFWYHRESTRITPPEISQAVELAMQESQSKGWQGAEVITSSTPNQQVITAEESERYHVDEDFAEQLAEARRITTYHNKEYWVTLEDGSLVHLNYNSRLIYPEKFGDRRDVILEGEAYFMVAHDKRRQFVVHTPQGDVTVYGTEFNVNTRNENEAVSVVLVKGSVSFTPTDGNEVLMSPGQELSFADDQLTLRLTDTAPYVAWNEGEFIFSDWTLGRILNVIARWYGLEVMFMDQELSNRKYSGSLSRYDDQKPTLETIEAVTGLNLTVKKQILYINQNK